MNIFHFFFAKDKMNIFHFVFGKEKLSTEYGQFSRFLKHRVSVQRCSI